MWINAVSPECVAELFHNYENALGICGKGSESGSRDEEPQPQRSRMNATRNSKPDSTRSREYFTEPGEAEWGC